MNLSNDTIAFYTNSSGSFSLTGISDEPEIWFTMKSQPMLPDYQSIIQISRTGSLLYANGKSSSASEVNVHSGCIVYNASASSIFVYFGADVAPILYGNLPNTFFGEIKTKSSASIVKVISQFDVDVLVALTKTI